ncbi:hypothetical protein A1351_08455 [Methylosinus sp. R-45379]|uniref:hypothetical protein n=1 Tax=Methylosinus sp. R-45379 TaxID=980563 RepID=UPI0007D7F987|nr:hypothetical protein [Methylosinus sp. R-45379]OAI30596.1 hypothetical protein A1351_08455 [Methylosinus sp. R-45379]
MTMVIKLVKRKVEVWSSPTNTGRRQVRSVPEGSQKAGFREVDPAAEFVPGLLADHGLERGDSSARFNARRDAVLDRPNRQSVRLRQRGPAQS